jgi:hypothetical protein
LKHLLSLILLMSVGVALGIAPAETINGTGFRRPFGYSLDSSDAEARTPKILYHGGPIPLGSVPVYIGFCANTLP